MATCTTCRCKCSPKTEFFNSFLALVACFFLFYITMGTAQSFGVLFSELRNDFQSGVGETSWIPSLNTGIFFVSGPIVGYLEQKYGYRVIAITGAIIIAVGMFASGFVTSLYYLYITYGVVCGIGFGFAFIAAHVAVPFHFHKRVSLAMAITSSGGGFGTLTTPLYTRIWLLEYTWRGTFILMAAVALQGVLCGAIMSRQQNLKRADKAEEQTQEKEISLTERTRKVFTNRQFAIFMISSVFVVLGYFTIYIILPDAAERKGFGKDEAAFLITAAGISGIIGRAVVGYIADKPQVNKCLLNSIALILGGIATIGCSFINSYDLLVSYSVFLGIFLGTFAFLQGVITVDIMGRQLLSLAFGYLVLFQGISATVGPPIVGWIVDTTGSYDEAFYCIGGVFIIGGLLSIIIPVQVRLSTKTVVINNLSD